MKRIAISFISLALMQSGYAEPSDSFEHFSMQIPDSRSELKSPQRAEQEEKEAFAFLEEDSKQLEEELLSLEQELEEEQTIEELVQNVTQMEEAQAQSIASLEEATVDTAIQGDTVLGELALEAEHIPLSSSLISQNTEANAEAPLIVEEIKTTSTLDQADLQQAPEKGLVAFSDSTSSDQEFMDEQASEEMTNETLIEDIQPVAPAAAIPSASETIRSAYKPIEISLPEVFSGSPTIYLTLLFLSILSLALWFFNLVSLKKYAAVSQSMLKNVRNKLISNHYDEVLSLCKDDKSFFGKMLFTGVSSRKYGLQFMLESMKSEGKRSTVSFWQRLNLLHDIAIIAPMLGLLGTVLGMFYAFYDLNRSFESISSLFDGLGVSVGTTVAGIFVAILAMVLHSISKYRLVRSLSFIENEAVALAHLIDTQHGQ